MKGKFYFYPFYNYVIAEILVHDLYSTCIFLKGFYWTTCIIVIIMVCVTVSIYIGGMGGLQNMMKQFQQSGAGGGGVPHMPKGRR